MVIWAGKSYSKRVIARIHRLPVLLRASLLALSLLAVLARPMYSTWCETHQLVHTMAALSHHSFHEDSSAERQLDADHARGAHGALHGGDHGGGAYADIATVVTVPVVRFDAVLNPPAVGLPAHVQRPARLLRPPIA